MRQALIIAAALTTMGLFAFVSSPARAEFVTGNKLYEWCSADRSETVYYQFSANCTSYVMGVNDGVEKSARLITDIAEMDKPFIITCVPDTVTSGQLREIVVNHLRSHPETRHEGASGIIMLAIMNAFPCDRD